VSHAAAGITVREVRPDEHGALGDLTVNAYAAVLGPQMGAGYAASLGDVAGRARTSVVLAAVACDGSVVGGISYLTGPDAYEHSDGTDAEASLRMLAVAPEAQGRGVGTALLRACIDRARSEGRARLLLHTTRSMVRAIRLYERLGFRRAPERDATIPEAHLIAYVLDLPGT
jgi:ribosomal protein S18 acetylase RimI-like enzyme